MEYSKLYAWGLTGQFELEAEQYTTLTIARVTEQHMNLYKVICENGFLQAMVSGKFIYNVSDNSEFPAVGDWVMIETSGSTGIIHHILTRKSVFGRKSCGTSHQMQIVATNIDTLFICMALNSDFNLRRLERYLSIAWDSNATPVIILTKSDLCIDLDIKLSEVSDIALGVDIVVCSCLLEDGYKSVMPYICKGHTAAFVGSSGVGKSTLINQLIGEKRLATKEIGNDGRGRHATTHRQMISLNCGGIVIDTPGMRELGTISSDTDKAFADIVELASKCKFRDCSHTSEPDCAVRVAIEKGTLNTARLENYKKIQTEEIYSNLTSREVDNEKINRMFGGKAEMKQALRAVKNKNLRR